MRQTLLMLIGLSLGACAFAQEAEVVTPYEPTRESVVFNARGANAPLLQGELSLPRRPDAYFTVPGAVICHPDPTTGGTMDNPVVLEIRDRLVPLGVAVLRFNFRGTGASEGRHGNGVGEVDDVLGALAFLREHPTVDPDHIGLAGYSFGSRVATMAAARAPDVRAVASVGYPTGLGEVVITDWQFLGAIERPMLFLSGTEDQYSSASNIRALRREFELEAWVVPIEGADHFFSDRGKLSLVGVQVAQFLAMHLFGRL